MCKLFSLSQGLQISEIKKTRNTRQTIKDKNESNFSLDTTQEMSTVKLYSTNDGLINSDISNTESQTSGQDTLLGIKQHDTNCVMFDNESNVDNLLLPLPQVSLIIDVKLSYVSVFILAISVCIYYIINLENHALTANDKIFNSYGFSISKGIMICSYNVNRFESK